jgi:16S rRNA (cytosine967-C5)-methyltransferase
MAAVSPARGAAFAILKAVELCQSHSDDLLRRKVVSDLSVVDCNLATTLVLGTLRWQIELDRRLTPLLKHPNAKLDVEVLIALRVAAFQLLHLDRIPARAAIDESVELTKQAGHRFASGMVNAVLRKLAVTARLRQPSDVPNAELELAETHPVWMVDRWVGHYGLEATRAICHHGQLQPSLTVRLENDVLDEELTAAGISLQLGELLSSVRTVLSGDITATAAFKEGRVRLQDEGSQLVADIVPRGASILDCCAAPGGKTLILAERNPSAHIVACEHSPQRLVPLGKRLKHLGERVECRPADATALSDESVYDVALVDVPCSGTGTLGRNPEIRHRLKLEDLPRQAERQKAILRSALRAVRPGGRVIYSTCSLEPEENEQVVAAVVAENNKVRQVPLQTRLVELRNDGILTSDGGEGLLGCCTSDGSLRLLPGVFHTDGFFIAMMEKTS